MKFRNSSRKSTIIGDKEQDKINNAKVVANDGRYNGLPEYNAETDSTLWVMRGYKGRWKRHMQMHVDQSYVVMAENQNIKINIDNSKILRLK